MPRLRTLLVFASFIALPSAMAAFPGHEDPYGDQRTVIPHMPLNLEGHRICHDGPTDIVRWGVWADGGFVHARLVRSAYVGVFTCGPNVKFDEPLREGWIRIATNDRSVTWEFGEECTSSALGSAVEICGELGGNLLAPEWSVPISGLDVHGAPYDLSGTWRSYFGTRAIEPTTGISVYDFNWENWLVEI